MKQIKHPGQKVALLIDTQNLYHCAKNLHKGAKVNFYEVLKTAVADRILIRALAYVIKTKSQEEKAFHEALEKLGIETRVKDLKEFKGGAKKADWDVGIAIDAIRISPGIDTLILASGDGDFLQLVEYLKNHGKRVEVIAFGKATSAQLKEDADEFIDMDKDTKKYLLK